MKSHKIPSFLFFAHGHLILHPATGKVLIPLGAGGISASAAGTPPQAASAAPTVLAAQAPGEGLACHGKLKKVAEDPIFAW